LSVAFVSIAGAGIDPSRSPNNCAPRISGKIIVCHTKKLSRLSFSERERFAERVGVLLGVEEEVPSDMLAMAIWLDRDLGDGDEKTIEGDEACVDLFSDRQALIPYQNVIGSDT
jgi:hypothetical protein